MHQSHVNITDKTHKSFQRWDNKARAHVCTKTKSNLCSRYPKGIPTISGNHKFTRTRAYVRVCCRHFLAVSITNDAEWCVWSAFVLCLHSPHQFTVMNMNWIWASIKTADLWQPRLQLKGWSYRDRCVSCVNVHVYCH